jgi:hypothetical protein
MIRYITQDRQTLATNLNVSRFKGVPVDHIEALGGCSNLLSLCCTPLAIGAAQTLWMV